MNNQKQLWDKLAQENSRYYINSDRGKGITEEEFRKSGEEDYQKYIVKDSLITLGGRFLEIGCGTGRMTEFIVKDFIVIGTDISNEMIYQAQKRLQNIEFMETDGFYLPLPDDCIDIAFSYLVFQHMKTRKMVESNFREVYRVLKPNGLFKVRVRTDKVNKDKWWGGIDCNESYPLSIGFKLLKKEPVEHFGLWLWLQK